jgi:hypothetical protein
MNRVLPFLVGPETALLLLTAAVYGFCARHGSYSSRDVELLERLVWLLPVLAVPLAFSTLLVPGAKSWWWLGRANLALHPCLMLCALRIGDSLGAPGSGPKGGEAAILIVLTFGILFAALASAGSAALILAEQRPAFAEWFRAHRFLGCLGTLVAAVPFGAATGVLAIATFMIAAAFSTGRS